MLYISASIGSYQTVKYPAKFISKTQSYEWKNIQLKTLRVNFPRDLK